MSFWAYAIRPYGTRDADGAGVCNTPLRGGGAGRGQRMRGRMAMRHYGVAGVAREKGNRGMSLLQPRCSHQTRSGPATKMEL